MAKKVIMPKQGLQMTEGKIIRWLVSEGEKVAEGEPLFEMETDKLTIVIDASETGTLLKILRKEGETVPITAVIAVIGETGDDYSDIINEKPSEESTQPDAIRKVEVKPVIPDYADKTGERIFATPRAKMKAERKGLDFHLFKGSGPDGLIIERDIAGISPIAARISAERTLNLDSIKGSGVNGKIMRSDVSDSSSARGSRIVEFTGMRKIIAGRMMNSLHESAQANHRMKIEMSEAIKLRENLNGSGRKISFSDIIMKVTAIALTEFPIINASYTENGIEIHDFVNLGFAVAIDGGLIVPVVRDADLLTIEQISESTSHLTEKARSGKLTPSDYSGGTFTITNLGMFDVDEFTAIVNQPESAILAIGKIARVPVADADDNISVKPIMTLSLTYDHRIIDGAPAAQFLQRIKSLLQNPYLMI